MRLTPPQKILESPLFVNISDSKHGQICGYLNPGTGPMNRKERSLYKPALKEQSNSSPKLGALIPPK